jgi:hypothetical protein
LAAVFELRKPAAVLLDARCFPCFPSKLDLDLNQFRDHRSARRGFRRQVVFNARPSRAAGRAPGGFERIAQ